MANGTAEIGEYSEILQACVKHCRAIGMEVYLYTEYVLHPTSEPAGKCFHNTSCLTSLAKAFETVAPGLNRITFTTLGVSDVYLQNSTEALSIGGALRRQVDALLHNELTRTQQGLGTYTLMDAHFHQAEHAECLADLQSSWPSPAHGGDDSDAPPPACVPDPGKGTTCAACNNAHPGSACHHTAACPAAWHACCRGKHCACTPHACSPDPSPPQPPSPTPPVPRASTKKHIDWYCGECDQQFIGSGPGARPGAIFY